jgi:hypothetical protein
MVISDKNLSIFVLRCQEILKLTEIVHACGGINPHKNDIMPMKDLSRYKTKRRDSVEVYLAA